MTKISIFDQRQFETISKPLYKAMCALGNFRVAHALCSYIDQQQFLYCIKSSYLDGRLREVYHELLIDIHLGAHANTRQHTQEEFIIPLTNETKGISLYEDPRNKDPGLPGMGAYTSLRPEMKWKTANFVVPVQQYYTEVPAFPLDLLKHHVIENLIEAVTSQTSICKNYAGGTQEHLFVPLLKVCDKLLLMQIFDDEDLEKLLTIIHSRYLGSKVDGHEELKYRVGEGLLQMKLCESIKLALCKEELKITRLCRFAQYFDQNFNYCDKIYIFVTTFLIEGLSFHKIITFRLFSKILILTKNRFKKFNVDVNFKFCIFNFGSAKRPW